MIFITGGAWQGKLAFAKTLVTETETNRDEGMDKDMAGELVADGRTAPYEAAFLRPVIGGFHHFVRRLIKDGLTVDPFIEAIEEKNPAAVITADELGCGIVPADAEERAWREAAGRAACRLAADSEAVYRVICGIPVRLK